MNVFVVKEGKFYTGPRKLNTDFAFEEEKDLHEHMEKVNGFKCVQADDQYTKPGTRFDNKEEKYGYDVVTLEVKEAVTEAIVAEIPLANMDIDALRFIAKENNIKSWHLKSRESLIEDLSAIKGGPSE